MADIYVRTFDLTKKLLSMEKQGLDVVCLSIEEADDNPDCGGPAALYISGANSHDPGLLVDDSIDSDESLAGLF